MVKISKKPYPGISKKERKTRLAKTGYDLRRNKRTGEFYAVKKEQVKKTQSRRIN